MHDQLLLTKTGRAAGRRLLNDDDVSCLVDRIDAERAARESYGRLRQLPESELGVIELMVVDQLSISEAAQALRILPATARVRLHRAWRRLRPEQSSVSADIPTQRKKADFCFRSTR